MGKSYVTKKNLFKFLLGSAFGILMFLCADSAGESFTTLLDFLKSWIKRLIWRELKLYHYGDAGLFCSSRCMILLQSRTGSEKSLSVESILNNTTVSGIEDPWSSICGHDRI